MRISEDVSNVLANSTVEGNILFLPPGQLDRKLYVSVNKVLTAIGGKWNRKEKGHIFDNEPNETIENILLTGEYTTEKKEFQFFETPEHLAHQLIGLAEIQDHESVLEPSAGRGRIAKLIPVCTCVELNPNNVDHLRDYGFDTHQGDFMDYNVMHDVIVANPPFTRQQDIDHVNHMIDIVTRRVVSVMSASVMWRDNKKTTEFRKRISDLRGTITPLPDDTFKESGTLVKTCVVVVDVLRNP